MNNCPLTTSPQDGENRLLNHPHYEEAWASKEIVITNHAKQRAKEHQVDPALLPELLKRSRQERYSFKRDVLKAVKYGASEADVAFYYSPVPSWTKKGLLFTCLDRGNRVVVITVTSILKKGLKLR
jgi:hypothetical protein